MGTELLVISRAAALVSMLQNRFGDLIANARQWPPIGDLPREVLIVDLAGASTAVWDHLERLSHQAVRPSVILLDHETAARDRLARIVADVLLPPDTDTATLIDTIEAYRSEHAFRAAALAIANSDLPYPLGRFMSAAFAQPAAKVRPLAVSLSLSESTLRSQWRKRRADPVVRLEDVIHRLHRVRRDAQASRSERWRADLAALVALVTPHEKPKVTV